MPEAPTGSIPSDTPGLGPAPRPTAGASVTRGHGRLELWLAQQRAAKATTLLSDLSQDATLLDVGCGSFPLFLQSVQYKRRIGVDKMISPALAQELASQRIELITYEAHAKRPIPLDDASVHAATMLAVFEHIPHDDLLMLLDQIARVLRPGGLWVMTTPAGWTGPILDLMSRCYLVSSDEIGEHQDSYSRRKIRAILQQTAMADWPCAMGSFEWGMNTWVRCRKP